MRWLALSVLWIACGSPPAPAEAPAPAAAPGSKYSEEFALPSRDRRDVSLTARARIRVRPGREADLAAHGGKDWYWTRVRPELRAAVRFEVQRRDLAALQRDANDVAAAVLARLRKRYAGTPFEILSVEIARVKER